MMKKKYIISFIILISAIGIAYGMTHLETVQWMLLPEYKESTMEGYVYLTQTDDYVSVSYTVYYDNTGLKPKLYNENRFFDGIAQIVQYSDASIPDELISQPESSRHYRSSVTYTDVFSGNQEQIQQLQEYLQNFDYQFALTDEKTAVYAYKLNRNFKLTVVE